MAWYSYTASLRHRPTTCEFCKGRYRGGLSKDAHDREDHTSVETEDELRVGDLTAEVLFTPGHTRGSVRFAVDGALLSDDTLFIRSVGRPDLEGDADVAREEASTLELGPNNCASN